MSKREYQHKIETLNEMMTAISDTPHDNIWDANFALWAIAERLEALVEVMDSEAREEEVSHLKHVICEQADALQQQRRQKEKAVEDYLALKQEMSP